LTAPTSAASFLLDCGGLDDTSDSFVCVSPSVNKFGEFQVNDTFRFMDRSSSQPSSWLITTRSHSSSRQLMTLVIFPFP
jgi:hypothetical protein